MIPKTNETDQDNQKRCYDEGNLGRKPGETPSYCQSPKIGRAKRIVSSFVAVAIAIALAFVCGVVVFVIAVIVTVTVTILVFLRRKKR